MIEAQHVTKVFYRPIRKQGLSGMAKTLFSTKKEKIIAVNDVNFSIGKGEIVGYIGANGAGKSTTIKMMCGILTPTEGKILIDGMEPYKGKYRNKVLKHIGVVFGQRTQLWWDLPLIESFKLLQSIYEIPEKDYNERLANLKTILELDKFMDSPVRTLSLGQRMRADLAAAFLHNPEIMFLDEPTIGLDVLVKEKIIAAIKQIHAQYQTTIILTTHDMNDIANLCERIIIIDEGKILFDGPLQDVKNRFGDTRQVFVSAKDRMDLDEFNKKFAGQLQFEIVDHYLSITFDADKVQTKDVLRYVFNHCEVIDVKIKENSIEKVVKVIYEKKAY